MTLLLGGGFSVVLLALTVMFLYFGLRRPDRIIVDSQKREILSRDAGKQYPSPLTS